MARSKVFLPLAVALVFAFLGGVIAYKWAQSQKAVQVVQQAASSDDVVSVAVAAADIPWGTKLSTDNIKMRDFLKKSLPESLPVSYFTDQAALASRVLSTDLKQGDIILESRLAPTSISTGGVTAVITPGKRALAVKGDKVVGLAGLIKPHDRVDVLVTLGNHDDRQQTTKVVLENITVLAAGTQMQKNDKGEALPVDVYTLEVTLDDGEKLALASNEGKLQFALRSAIDPDTVLTSGATVKDTLESYLARASSPAIKKPDVQTSAFSVELIRGTSRENVKF